MDALKAWHLMLIREREAYTNARGVTIEVTGWDGKVYTQTYATPEDADDGEAAFRAAWQRGSPGIFNVKRYP